MEKRKICIVTGSRAEYGLLSPLIKKVHGDPDLEFQLVVTGSHLSYEHGLTYKVIEEDGYVINEKVEMLLSSDTSTAISKSIGIGTIGFSEVLNRLQPDVIVLLGDRYELLSIASVALVQKIPIAHIHGGETTLGAYDDAIRHAITKMATIHFPSSDLHKERIIQMGENPESVFVVGAAGIDNIKNMDLLNKEDLAVELGINWSDQVFVVAYHPETMKKDPASSIVELLNAFDDYENTTIIFTKANSDENGRKINQAISNFVNESPDNRYLFDSLGQLRYLSVLKEADVVLGNSSSALLEAPYLSTASVNIGERQKGRQRPPSVIDSQDDSESIKGAISDALLFDFAESNVEIFGDGTSAVKMWEVLKDNPLIINQPFYEYKGGLS
ncbi:UDP-N-acetylglucosamine 2-epimerase [Alkalicoccus halolimnae]|uniref:UDP-N-acetylglucosamine 2-epimerase n=1 Tax=Alkalicoccus halolimnae TaxID=1667239 RepID=A0A5C7FNU9_9BACI|nr:UDP-N-acetylglucosamine 2-epimerase [Alkalicoccus halolimnae]TXF87016.1 UDP-N-acetylglucosamine 2-epimerase (hydrolyzing) [Alkalicoccus halolimnae]